MKIIVCRFCHCSEHKGLTKGLVMPFSGFLTNAIGPKVMMDLISPCYSFTFRQAW